MNILFLTIGRMQNIMTKSIYTDLLRRFKNEGHNVYAVAPVERREGYKTELRKEFGINVLRIRTGNLTKTNVIEKGISTLLLEKQFLAAIKKYYRNVKFDLILYSTPPITFANVIRYVKRRDNAKTYLLLKDIFPQNAVDLEMFSSKSIIYKYFRNKEKQLYKISDHIGCMSQANVDYILNNNPEISKSKVHVNPNSIEVVEYEHTVEERESIRNKYGLPMDKKIFVYGGNLGKPQGIDFLIECIKSQKDNKDIFFLVVGSGTEYYKLKKYYDTEKQADFKLLNSLPKDEYDSMIRSCDVGMIFLDKRFTIPNFPSRLLSYMQAKLPVLAVTDVNTDIGKVIVDGQFGCWCEAGKIDSFKETLYNMTHSDMYNMGDNAYKYLLSHYTVKNTYEIIMERLNENSCK